MATFAARRLQQMLRNTEYIVAIELLAAAQGIEFLRPLQSSPVLEGILGLVRSVSPAMMVDRSLAPDMEQVRALITQGRIGLAGEAQIQELNGPVAVFELGNTGFDEGLELAGVQVAPFPFSPAVDVGSLGGISGVGPHLPLLQNDLNHHPLFCQRQGHLFHRPRCLQSKTTSEVLGSFAIYHATRFAPSELDIYIIEQSARLASLAVERKRMEMRVQHVAFHDALTGLPNRILLHDRLEQARAACKRHGRHAALLFIDLDNFKPLNDEYGHDAGDLLLKEVAQRLIQCVREVDTVARFGGDEFVVILSELDADMALSTELATAVAEKIRAALSLPYVLQLPSCHQNASTVEHHCSASIGAVLFTHSVGTEADIVKWADLAMYQAKAAGRNRIHFMAPQV